MLNYSKMYIMSVCMTRHYRTILQKVKEQTSQSPEPSSSPRQEEPVTASVAVSSSEVLVKSGVEGARRGDNKTDILKEKPHHVNVENVSVSLQLNMYIV